MSQRPWICPSGCAFAILGLASPGCGQSWSTADSVWSKTTKGCHLFKDSHRDSRPCSRVVITAGDDSTTIHCDDTHEGVTDGLTHVLDGHTSFEAGKSLPVVNFGIRGNRRNTITSDGRGACVLKKGSISCVWKGPDRVWSRSMRVLLVTVVTIRGQPMA